MVTLTQVKNFLEIATSNTEFDTLLNAFIDRATALINNYLGYDLAENTQTYNFVGNGKNEFVLPFVFISNIENLYERSKPTNEWNVKSDYEFYTINNITYLYSDSLLNGYYKVDVTSGFAVIPNDVQQKCLEIISYYFRESGAMQGKMSGLYGIESIVETTKDMTMNYKFKSMFKEIEFYLNKYKLLYV